MNNRKRNTGINIRVTPEEKRLYQRRARACRLSLSEYLRQLANGHNPRELPTKSVDRLCEEIEMLIQEFDYDHTDERFKEFLSDMLRDVRRLYYEDTAHGDNEDLARS